MPFCAVSCPILELSAIYLSKLIYVHPFRCLCHFVNFCLRALRDKMISTNKTSPEGAYKASCLVGAVGNIRSE